MARLRHPEVWLIVLVVLTVPSAVWSEEPVPAGYRSIAKERGVPYTVLYAVALTESGRQVASGVWVAGSFRLACGRSLLSWTVLEWM